MTNPGMTIAEIRARHPFPWRDEVHPNGIVKLIDANGAEVGLFTILAHCVLTTNAIAKQGASAT
jgi:hypothetical protein